MSRVYREEIFTRPLMGWLNANGDIVYDTDDRFNTHYVVDDWGLSEQGYVLHDETVSETGLQYRSLEEIMRLGFTTREYQAMVLYSALSKGQDYVRSERELTALMSSTFLGHMLDRSRAGTVADARSMTVTNSSPAEGSGRIHRPEIRSEKVSADVQAKGRGRFELEYRFCDDDGTKTDRGLTLAQTGIMDWKLSDAVWWGFTAAEYETMLLFEYASNGKDHVRSEDELNVLFPGSAHDIERTLRLYEFRKAQELAGARDHRPLHPEAVPDPDVDPWWTPY